MMTGLRRAGLGSKSPLATEGREEDALPLNWKASSLKLIRAAEKDSRVDIDELVLGFVPPTLK